eukprot:CAMPEP_0195657228 /NCGR_PEP_ID=MMETSP0815-20121206/35404_1 /TAXON_ID=97485 /ORGANISM="Prymnesium parvum, Strain Texoma1" /LENGTH=121 /DNA_ID=CAMNT_0040801617 /DNA_START=774 /DNA_END=1140 /DNA_ORIENTATION=-
MLITRGGGDGGSSGEGGRCGGLVVTVGEADSLASMEVAAEMAVSENAYLVGVSPYKACTNFLVEHQSRRTKAWGPFWKLVAVIWGATHRKQKLISWKVISWPPELRQRDAALGLQRSNLIL